MTKHGGILSGISKRRRDIRTGTSLWRTADLASARQSSSGCSTSSGRKTRGCGKPSIATALTTYRADGWALSGLARALDAQGKSDEGRPRARRVRTRLAPVGCQTRVLAILTGAVGALIGSEREKHSIPTRAQSPLAACPDARVLQMPALSVDGTTGVSRMSRSIWSRKSGLHSGSQHLPGLCDIRAAQDVALERLDIALCARRIQHAGLLARDTRLRS